MSETNNFVIMKTVHVYIVYFHVIFFFFFVYSIAHSVMSISLRTAEETILTRQALQKREALIKRLYELYHYFISASFYRYGNFCRGVLLYMDWFYR